MRDNRVAFAPPTKKAGPPARSGQTPLAPRQEPTGYQPPKDGARLAGRISNPSLTQSAPAIAPRLRGRRRRLFFLLLFHRGHLRRRGRFAAARLDHLLFARVGWAPTDPWTAGLTEKRPAEPHPTVRRRTASGRLARIGTATHRRAPRPAETRPIDPRKERLPIDARIAGRLRRATRIGSVAHRGVRRRTTAIMGIRCRGGAQHHGKGRNAHYNKSTHTGTLP